MCEVGSMEQAESGVVLQRDPHTISHCHHLVHLCTLVGVDLECCLQQSEKQQGCGYMVLSCLQVSNPEIKKKNFTDQILYATAIG